MLMNVIVKIAVFVSLAFITTIQCYAQPSSKEIRERKKILKKTFANGQPEILLNGKEKISVEEFLNLSEELDCIVPLTATSYSGPVLVVDTKAFTEEEKMRHRKTQIKNYRQNEMQCFFGSKAPLIYFGDSIISKEQYYLLDEDTVAFVNFYPTDFVKQYYAEQGGENGIVYVCPHEMCLSLPYSTHNLPIPIGDRNYSHPAGPNGDPCYNIDNRRGEDEYSYIRKALSKYKGEIPANTKATIVIACVVDTHGHIKPVLIEDFRDANELGITHMNRLIDICKEVILTMPEWEPTCGNIYDRVERRVIPYSTEGYIQIPIAINF